MAKEALGKGRAAIFDGLSPATSDLRQVAGDKPPVTSNKSQEAISVPATSDKLPAASSKSPVTSGKPPVASHQPKIDSAILAQALSEAKKSPKITVFSPMVSAVLRYKQLTTVRYSFSTEAGERLEKAVKDAYPEIWEEVEKVLAKK